MHAFEYQSDGVVYALTVEAPTEEAARRRIAAMQNAQYMGLIVSEQVISDELTERVKDSVRAAGRVN